MKRLFKRFCERIRSEGIVEVLYALSERINFPRRGFPRNGIDKFMMGITGEVATGGLLLDAGAGHQPYKNFFEHVRYESCDSIDVLEEIGGDTGIVHTFYCDLEDIPKESDTYDTIICNQVLEHVRHPQRVVNELYRILKPGGKLFLTVPQCSGIHMPPHNYFNFTYYGLEFLFGKAGFHINYIRPLGGTFWLLGKVLQKSYEVFVANINRPVKALFFPFHILCRIFMLVPCFLFFYMDHLDKEKGWTLNYGCHCVKPDGK